MALTKLPWDTDYFKKNVYRIDSSDILQINLEIKNVEAHSLIYVFSDSAIPELSDNLMDIKRIYSRKCLLSDPQSYENDCYDFDEMTMSYSELEKLAIDSSVYSRFRIDTKIEPALTDNLYRLWIKKAVNEKQIYRNIVSIKDKKIAGMIAIQTLDKILKIDLVAVSSHYRGLGIGHNLIQSCFALAHQKNTSEVQVTTQGHNKAACSLYEKNGFTVFEQKFVYHLYI